MITINSDGEICPTDEIMNCDPGYYNSLVFNVNDISFKNYIETDLVYNFNIKELPDECKHCETKFYCKSYLMGLIPTKCQDCEFKFVCSGDGIGNIGNRYSKENGFDNPSVYCNLIKKLYSRAISVMIKSGYDSEKLEKLFVIDNEKDHETLCGRSMATMLEDERVDAKK